MRTSEYKKGLGRVWSQQFASDADWRAARALGLEVSKNPLAPAGDWAIELAAHGRYGDFVSEWIPYNHASGFGAWRRVRFVA